MNKSVYAMCAGGLLAAALADAQTGDPSSDVILEEIIVTAAPLDRSLDDLTQPALVLDADELLLKAAGSIGETLAQELGVSATYFGPVSGRPVIRGQAGPRISVLQGGVSSLDVADLSPDHAVPIEPLFAERIEVIRGPSTLLYGSSAAGGVVNVIDNRIPQSLPELPLTVAIELRGDTAAKERALAGRLDGGSGGLAWHLDAFQRETDDIDIPGFATADPADRPAEEQPGTVVNSAGESEGYAGGLSLIGDNGFIGISVSTYANDYGLPGPEEGEEEEGDGEPLIAPGPFIELEQTRWDLRGEYALSGAFDKARIRVGRNGYQHSEIEPTGAVATLFENDAWEGRIELVHAPIGRWRGAVGLQLNERDFSAVGEEAFIVPTRTRAYGVFLVEEQIHEWGLIELGARVESLEHKPSGNLAAYDDTAISLAAGLVWNFAPDYDLSANLSRSERNLDIAELYSEGAHLATGLFEVGLFADGGGQARQEVANNLDISLHHHTDTIGWKMNAFFNRLSDYTFRAETAAIEDGLPVAPYRQQDAEFFGFEAELTLALALGGGASSWDMRLFTDYVRGKSAGGDLPRIQPPRFGAQLDYSGVRWSAGVQAILHGKQNNVSSFPTDSFTMLNANLALKIGSDGPFVWDLFVRASNLLDEDARRSTSFRAAFVPLPGKSFHAGLRARFN